jgi:hypothetical protein
MNSLAAQIEKACFALGLKVDIGFTVSFDDGSEICAIARIRDLGWPNGMLIVTSSNAFKDYSKKLANAGYGISVMGEPSQKGIFDLNSWRETFIDWRWSGDPALKPKWMLEPSLDELKQTLQNSSNSAFREDAAQKIALIHWENDQSQRILSDLIQFGSLDKRLRFTCIEALADFWIRRGKIDRDLYHKLDDVGLKQKLAPWFNELKN